MKVLKFIKNWTLPISMIAGALSYFIYVNIPGIEPTKPFVNRFISIIQPVLIFAMLFITFCKVSPTELRICRWHIYLLLFQLLTFTGLGMMLILFKDLPGSVLIEGAMLCLICPTATAAAVITGKLGGNAAHLTTYTILINLASALIIPLILPLIHANNQGFTGAFLMILAKIFPMLFLPFIAAILIRYTCPKIHRHIINLKDLAFHLWAVSLALAIGTTVKSMVHSQVGIGYEIGIGAISLICCAVQFYLGKKIGCRFHDEISAGQALGQKNTVFAIWLGYTFLTPVTSIAGGFYSVWHNIFNSYQLYQQRKKENSPSTEIRK